jgi:hypothetical protein
MLGLECPQSLEVISIESEESGDLPGAHRQVAPVVVVEPAPNPGWIGGGVVEPAAAGLWFFGGIS